MKGLNLFPNKLDWRSAVQLFFLAALTLAHRALAAARILARPAGEIRRLGRAVPFEVCATRFCLAHLALWAAAILRRAATDITRFDDRPGVLLPLREVNMEIALSRRSRSSCSPRTTASKFVMVGILPAYGYKLL
jgi:hypothetical protein